MNTDFLEETHEDETGQKLAGLTGETFGNWLCIQYLFVSEQLRGQRISLHRQTALLHKKTILGGNSEQNGYPA